MRLDGDLGHFPHARYQASFLKGVLSSFARYFHRFTLNLAGVELCLMHFAPGVGESDAQFMLRFQTRFLTSHFSRFQRFLHVIMGLLCGLRSEEHTSELQSRENLVCRLLLENKKET